MNHKEWLDNEYSLWAEALSSSTVHNFREHPQVKRMLSEVDPNLYHETAIHSSQRDILMSIQNIGYKTPKAKFLGAFIRMTYWAQQVLKMNAKSICEIGGGVGEFYAILRALGYTGRYYIYDLPAVKEFQNKFLKEAERLTGLDLSQNEDREDDLCVSFYALGEFDDNLKHWYIEKVVNICEHGFIIWNSHSGASEEINIGHTVSIEDLADGTFKITW